jgi:L-threonylcarbamoyladenylate synthase
VQVLAVDPDHPDPDVVSLAARLLKEGAVIAGPSDTVYGFLARPTDPVAMARLAALKEREGPFILLVASWDAARAATRGVAEATWSRIGMVWPGPVTVVLPAAAGGTIALRMPKTRLLVEILGEAGEPLASTSANRAGAGAPVSAAEVLGAFPHEALPLLLDGGRALSSEPSTLVDLSGKHARLLRSGLGDARALLDPPPNTT